MKKLGKFNLKKYSIPSLFILCSLIFASLFIFLKNDVPKISSSGSSGVYPLMAKYSDIYSEADLTVQAGGSSVGIGQVKEKKVDLGNSSKNPHLEEYDNLKTVTLALDAIAIIYTLPTSCDSSESFKIDKDNAIDLFKMFAGYEVYTYEDFGIKNCKQNIKPILKAGGAQASGTAEAFLVDSNLVDWKTQNIKDYYSNPSLKDIFLSGTYGQNATSSAESNSETYKLLKSSIKNNKVDQGYVTYISLGFAEQQEDSLIYKAKIKWEDKYVDSIVPNISTGDYKWVRPLNTIINLDAPLHVKTFVLWALENERKKTIDSLGFIQLTTEQRESMYKNDEFWVSDKELGRSGAEF